MRRSIAVIASILAGFLLLSLLLERSAPGQAAAQPEKQAADGLPSQLPGKFVHIALYNFKPGAPEGTPAAFAEEANQCFSQIPSVRGFRVGPPAKRGTPAAYSVQPAGDYQIGVVLCFDNFAGLAAYGNHPKHNELKKKYAALFGKIVAYDFES